ncbi:hypothetical protein [Vibrio hippocampi]|uniref:Outer membrane protein beta-barrel domain-containing protein n=1 Tax=Vibrio hippocampi TaxID=654686 RepID=A0ABM8ZM07_9VIBR|nr:hypothetical protein [Vibrio hippocampi]CAH0529535.1 hypothetical protein VHP8226_03289 [Vibrio hippocampi]
MKLSNILLVLSSLVVSQISVAKETDLDSTQAWGRTLPFYSELALYSGKELPLPIGISLLYTNVKQQVALTDLAVNYQGGNYVPIDFVPFDDSSVNNHTPQIKLDVWVLPFLNLFTTVGKVNGASDVAFAIDGDLALNQLGIDCDNPSLGDIAACRALAGKSADFDFDVDIEGMSYTLGFMAVYGWDNYFVSVPVSFTKMDLDRSDTEGKVINVLPRAGRNFEFGDGESMAVYLGASYFRSELTLTGQVPGVESIGYKIDQVNTEQWAGLIGLNYSFNKRWSLAFEYTGLGTVHRKQIISNLSFRY